MALRKPHKRMKMVGRRVFAYCMTVLPHPSLLDSGLRRNDETGRSNGCHLFSYQSLMPAAAGTPRYEKPELWFGTANWHGGFCHAPRRPSGGQAPRLAKSSTALHLLIPPSTIGLQFGRFRRWRAGNEVDWRAHPGSESGTCFRTNDDMWFADYRNGLGGLTVSTNCLSALVNTLEILNIKELKTRALT